MKRSWHKVGHRGAPREFPANTMRSFQRAVERGCTMVECDVRRCGDGTLMLAHDAHVTDVRGQRYEIEEHSAATLQALDLGAGEGVPTLAELVAWAQNRCAVMADMKCEDGDVESNVVAALAPLPPDRKIVPGAGKASRARFRACDAALPLSLSLDQKEGRLLLDAAGDAGFDTLLSPLDTQAVTWEHPLLNEARIAALHRRGLQVFAWTVDDRETMRRLLDAGVDGLISNRADLMQTL